MTTNKQLRELAERATPGPWGWDGPVWGYDTENEAPWLIQERGSDVVITGEIQCSEANAEYIATASPEVITALLDENEALQAELESLKEYAELGKAVQQKREPGKRYGCHCDLEEGMEPDGCVIDSNEHLLCNYATHIEVKEQCSYWRVIAIDAAMQGAQP